MTKAEAGSIGGKQFMANYIIECPLCGHRKLKPEFYEIRSKGGKSTANKTTHEDHVKWGAMGGRGNKKNRGDKNEPKEKTAAISGVHNTDTL